MIFTAWRRTREDEVDKLIQKHAKNWRLERMPAVDRNLLRTAVAEMIGFPKTPAPIVINETLEIAKRYAAPESLQFLNGVLDAIGRELLDARLNRVLNRSSGAVTPSPRHFLRKIFHKLDLGVDLSVFWS